MTNRKIVVGLIGTYAGFVLGVTTLGTPATLLGSALNFFTDPESQERLAEFDHDGNAVLDLFEGARIVEFFQSAPQYLGPIFGRSFVPGVIRLDDDFFLPGHEAAPSASEAGEESFDDVEELWSEDEIRVSNEFQGGTAEPGVYLVPQSSSSSLPASLAMPLPETSGSAGMGSSVSSEYSSLSTDSFMEPSDVTSSSSAAASSEDFMEFGAASEESFSSSGMEEATEVSSAPAGVDCDFNGETDDMCDSICQLYWPDKNDDGIKEVPVECS